MRPSRDEMLMRIAEAAADRSSCSRASVGAVISREGRPISLGYNGAPAGMPHCSHECDCRIPPLVAGNHEPHCPAGEPCLISVHAEANALAFAAKYGVATNDAELHINFSPCKNCSMLIINSGIVRVRWAKEYRISEGIDLMRNAGIDAKLLVW